MTALKMFEKLGYKPDINDERIRYFNSDNNYYVVFFLKYGIYTVGSTNENEDVGIDIELHEAINKQVEELRRK